MGPFLFPLVETAEVWKAPGEWERGLPYLLTPASTPNRQEVS